MIELAFIVCLKTNPAACEERVLSYLAQDTGPGMCMIWAQPELAAWANTYPNFTIANWKCRNSDRKKVDI